MRALIKKSDFYGTINSVPSKSAAHRALICAALADKPTKIVIPHSNADIDATAACLRAMGAGISKVGEYFEATPISVPRKDSELKCGESGSTLRFLLPVAAAVSPGARFYGEGRLPLRPIGELQEAMRQNGASFDGDSLPFSVSGKLRPGIYEIRGDISSQYVSGLLMALPLLDGDSRIVLKSPLNSAPYVDMTVDMLSQFGISAEITEDGFFIRGKQKYLSPEMLEIEGDWSGAAFFLAAGAMGGNVTVSGLRTDSKQGDKAIADILRRFGAEVFAEGGNVTVVKAPLKACEIDVSNTPDLFPVLAVLGAQAEGKTVLYNASSLRLKESDRIKASYEMIKSLGGTANEYPDRLEITGTKLKGGTVNSYGDHRIVMSAAIAAAFCDEETAVIGVEAAGKSYPGFFEHYSALGGKVTLEEMR